MTIDKLSPDVATQAIRLGRQIRSRREALGVSATATAESARISRVTLHRIERGEATVNMAAYLSVLAALGLELEVVESLSGKKPESDGQPSIPVEIALSAFPVLKSLAWQIQGTDNLSPQEAWDIYDRNWRHADLEKAQPQERALIDALRRVFGGGKQDV